MAQQNSRVQRFAVKILGGLNIALFRITRGRIGGRLMGAEVMLMTTTGRKTGRPRVAPLVVGRDGDHLIIVASFGGQPQHPFWYSNLVANPRATVELRGGERREVIARTANPEERARLWPMMVGIYSGYAGYQKKTTREIPIVILSRA